LDLLYVFAALVWGLPALALAAIFFGSKMEPDAPERNPRIQAWMNAYLQTDEGRRAIGDQARRMLGWTDGIYTMGPDDYLPRLPIRWDQGVRVEPMTAQAPPARIYPLANTERAQLAADAVEAGLAPIEALEGMTLGTIPIPVMTGHQRRYVRQAERERAYRDHDQVDAYRYAMGALAGQRLHEALVDALQNPNPMTEGHDRCGRVNCTAPQCVTPNPEQTDRLTPATLADARRALVEAGQVRLYPRIDDALFYRAYPQEWAPPPEDQAAYAAERERQAEEARVLAEQKQQAKLRAEQLLREKMTPEQQQTWEMFTYVEVQGETIAYRIRGDTGYSMNIDGNDGLTYCAYPKNAPQMPIQDVVLAQMLWLTCDEKGFLEKAQRTPSTRSYPDWPHKVRTFMFTVDDMMWPRNTPDYRLEMRNRGARPQAGPERANVEAWVPECCSTRGCILTLERIDDHYAPRLHFRHRLANDLPNQVDHIVVLTQQREWPAREIRRYLERHLTHRAAA
jgi:hypothetical protein